MFFYHLDSEMKFKKGDIVNFVSLPTNSNTEIVDYCKTHFPEGLSNMGKKYSAYITPQSFEYSVYTSEILLEIFRQKSFSHLPSRFQCIFCSDSLEQCELWFKQLKLNSANVLVFESDKIYRFDAAWRDIISANLNMCSVELFSNNYWSGKIFSEDSRVEYLLPLPLKVVDVIPYKH